MRANIYLASGSPRRKELIKRVRESGVKVLEHDHIEENIDHLSPKRFAIQSAYHKVLSASKKVRIGIIIGADTVVVCNGKILGKPRTKENAAKMLRLISGKTLDVITGLAVIEKPSGKVKKGSESTKVKIKELSKKEISDYVRTGEPLDKAGAFAIQGRGGAIVEWIEGDYYNVVGLPVNRLKKLLFTTMPKCNTILHYDKALAKTS